MKSNCNHFINLNHTPVYGRFFFFIYNIFFSVPWLHKRVIIRLTEPSKHHVNLTQLSKKVLNRLHKQRLYLFWVGYASGIIYVDDSYLDEQQSTCLIVSFTACLTWSIFQQ